MPVNKDFYTLAGSSGQSTGYEIANSLRFNDDDSGFLLDAGTGAGAPHTFVSAVTDGTILVYNPTALTSPIPKVEDWNILLDPNVNAPTASFTPTNATYNPANGDFTVTLGSGHGVTTSNNIRIAPESFTFTCAMDNNATEHNLPESGQNAYGN